MYISYYQLIERESKKFGFILPPYGELDCKRYNDELAAGQVPLVVTNGYELGDMYERSETGFIVSERLKNVLELFSNPKFVSYLPVKIMTEESGQEGLYYRVWFDYVPGVLSKYSLGYKSPYECLVPVFMNEAVKECGDVFTCGAVWEGGIYVTEDVYNALKKAHINKNIQYVERTGLDEDQGDACHSEYGD